jgi:hypothetical protein
MRWSSFCGEASRRRLFASYGAMLVNANSGERGPEDLAVYRIHKAQLPADETTVR